MRDTQVAVIEVAAIAWTPGRPTTACQVWNAVPHTPAIHMLRSLRTYGYHLLYVTDRPERLRWDTAAWIDRHIGGPAYGLLMRRDGDTLPGGEVLSGLYQRCIQGRVADALVICSLADGHAGMWAANDLPYIVVDDTHPAGTVGPVLSVAKSAEQAVWAVPAT